MRFGIGGGNRILRGGASVGRGGVRGGVGVGPFSISGGSRGRKSNSGGAQGALAGGGLLACVALYYMVIAGLTFLGVVFVLLLLVLWVALVVFAPFLALVAVKNAFDSSLTSIRLATYGSIAGIDFLSGKNVSYLKWTRWFKSALMVLAFSVLASFGVEWLSGRLERVFENCDFMDPVARDCMVPWDVVVNHPGFWSRSSEYIHDLRTYSFAAIVLVFLLFPCFFYLDSRAQKSILQSRVQGTNTSLTLLAQREVELRNELVDFMELDKSTRVTSTLLQQLVAGAYWRGYSNREVRRLVRVATDLEILRALKRGSDWNLNLLSRRTRRYLAFH